MKNSFLSRIQENCGFPQGAFNLPNGKLHFHDLDLSKLIAKYGTPFKLTYLPKISEQISNAQEYFNSAIKRHSYSGKYQFCYCTKVNHFSFVVEKAISDDVHLETSSSLDIELLLSLHRKGVLKVDRFIIHNGVKSDDYLRNILRMQEIGFDNSIIVLDNEEELSKLLELSKSLPLKIGIRLAIEEEDYEINRKSRLGMSSSALINLYHQTIKGNRNIELKMLHFFVDSGLDDSPYYWTQFDEALRVYSSLKKLDSSLEYFNIGGGYPIQNNLEFNYPYKENASKIVERISASCHKNNITEPDIFTEFGKYTVGESGALIFKVDHHKIQDNKEHWYIIDNSLMNTIPDAYSLDEKFILLPINKWDQSVLEVNIGGMSCDHSDYYSRDSEGDPIFLPEVGEKTEPLYIGFFHTAAYQDSVSGYGGVKHCLIPAPKHIIIDKNADGTLTEQIFSEEHGTDQMLQILGYNID